MPLKDSDAEGQSVYGLHSPESSGKRPRQTLTCPFGQSTRKEPHVQQQRWTLPTQPQATTARAAHLLALSHSSSQACSPRPAAPVGTLVTVCGRGTGCQSRALTHATLALLTELRPGPNTRAQCPARVTALTCWCQACDDVRTRHCPVPLRPLDPGPALSTATERQRPGP